MDQQQFANTLLDIFQQQANLYLAHVDILKKYAGKTGSAGTSKANNNKATKPVAKNSSSSEEPREEKEGPITPVHKVEKKKRKKPDPNAPPRSLSGYQIFIKEQYPSFKTDNPHVDPKQIMSLMSKEWNSLDPDFKLQFTQKAEKLKGNGSSSSVEPGVLSPNAKAQHLIEEPPHSPKPVSKPAVTARVPDPVKEEVAEEREEDDADRKKKKKKKHHHHHEDESNEESRKKHKKSHRKESE